jgi:hypothetical protein
MVVLNRGGAAVKNILRDAWFLVIPGTLLLAAALRDMLAQPAHLRMDAPLSAAAGLALLAGAAAFGRHHRFRGAIFVILGAGIALAFPNFVSSDATYYVWLGVCLLFAAGAMYLSLTHRRI